MIEDSQLQIIKHSVLEFFEKMTVPVLDITVSSTTGTGKDGVQKDAVQINLNVDEPQVLIGHSGQTMAEIERLFRIIFNKKFQKDFYVIFDINEYRAKKSSYLKEMAVLTANEVAQSGQEKILPPMSAYERRIVHNELAQRTDVITESHGDGLSRSVIIKPR
jgi:spoIIIJ-associated protein